MLNQIVLLILKIICRIASFKARFELEKSLRAPEIAQLKVLGHLHHILKSTERVQQFQWKDGSNYADFIRKIPVVQYADLEPEILSQMHSLDALISPEPVKFYERTSGSSGAAKFIPYTRSYLNILNRLFLLWADDIFQSSLRFRSVKTFLCVTPPLTENTSNSPIQIGSETDADYLASWLRPFLKRFLAVPLDLHSVRDPLHYNDLLCLYLIAAEDLEIISLWSPSLWLAMLDHFNQHRQRLLVSLQEGFYATPERRWVFKTIRSDRARALEAISLDWQRIWPDLKFISCWDQGHAKVGAERLAAMFPNALLQGKGLLATEAPVSLPLMQIKAAVPFLTDVWIEGEDLSDHKVYPLWQMQADHSYKVIVSLPNGLLRYHLGDVVKVTGFYKQTPQFEFVGRDAQVMDMVGEKLSETFLTQAVAQVIPNLEGNWSLFPVQNENKAYYHMFVDTQLNQETAAALDEQLCAAHHYQLARRLGQLGSITLEYSPHWSHRFLALSAQKGQQLGNIKLAFLQKRIYSERDLEFLRGQNR